MPGRWNSANPPKRPGAYTNFAAKPQIRMDAPLSGIMAMPIVSSWGPDSVVVELDSMGDAVDIFGNDTQSEGYRALYQAFKGEGVDGKGGAARVLAYRMTASAGAKATKNFANTNASPVANALALTAVYKGTFGNSISAAIVANAVDGATKQDLVIYIDGNEVERFVFTKASPNTVVALVAESDFVRAVVNNNADPLATTAALSLTGGDDGLTLTSTEWTAAMTALGTKQFSVFCPFNLSDSTLQNSIRAWAADPVTGHNVKGKRFHTALGAPSADSLATCLTRTASLASEDVSYAGAFTVTDSNIVDTNGDPVVLSPAAFAPRIAGIICATGEVGSITFSRLADVKLVSGLSTDADFVSATAGGVLTVAEDSNPVSPARIEVGVNTYQLDTEEKPKEIFSSIRFVRIMASIEMAITAFVESNVIGRLTMNANTREYVLGAFQKMMAGYVAINAITEDYKVYVAANPPPSDTDDFINLVYEITLGRDVKQVRNTVVVG